MISSMTGTHDCDVILDSDANHLETVKPSDETPKNDNQHLTLKHFEVLDDVASTIADGDASNVVDNCVLQQKTSHGISNGVTFDDPIDLISEGDLSSVHEDGEISEGLSNIYSDEDDDNGSNTSMSSAPLKNVAPEESGKLEENAGNNFTGAEVVDSPASTLSNVSPERAGEEDEDDTDVEDDLYLRLMALKSMAPDLTLEDGGTAESSMVNSPADKVMQSPESSVQEEDNELVNEMEELLNEADQAADEPQVVVQSSSLDSVDIQSVLQKIRETSKHKSVETEMDDDVIIPCMNPGDGDSSPIAMEEDSDNEITIVEEVPGKKRRRKKSVRSGRIKIQDFARIKFKSSKDLLANCDQNPSDLPVNRIDDDVQIIEQSSNCEAVDMELSCENEAEIQFFKDQIDPEKQKDALFPPSVWEIGDFLREPPPPPPPPLPTQTVRMRDVMNFDSDEARYDAFLRAVFDKNIIAPSPVVPTNDSLKSLDNRKRRRSEESHKTEKAALPQPIASKRVRKENVEKEKSEEVEDTEALRANILISMIEKRKKIETKKKTADEIVKATTPTSKINPELQKLGDQVIKMRHFPNLFKQVIVPISTSDDESEKLTCNTVPSNKTDISDFSLKLDTFLKDVRQRTSTSETKKKATPPPKPARKNPPMKKSFKSFSAPKSNSSLSVAVKTDLMTSTVSHLPQSKQAEYKKLKELIAKKEKAKLAQQERQPLLQQNYPTQKSSANKNNITAIEKVKEKEARIDKVEEKRVAAARTDKVEEKQVTKSDSKPVQEDDEEDPELLRSLLLASMMVKKKTEQSHPEAKSSSTAVRKRIIGPGEVTTASSQPALIVSFANTEDGARDVQVSKKLMSTPAKAVAPSNRETKPSLPPVKALVKPPLKSVAKPIPTTNILTPVVARPSHPAILTSKKIVNANKPAAVKFPNVKAPDFIPFSSSSSVAAAEGPAPGAVVISNLIQQTVNTVAPAEPLSVAPVIPDLLSTTTPSIPMAPVSHTPEELAKAEARELLKRKESEFSVIQRDMMQEIFKLSAQMSQLKGETKVLEAAESFADDLRRQLAETEQVIARSRARITHLKSTVKTSTVAIVGKRPNMIKMEEECKMKGIDLYGPIYKIPQTPGSQNIKKKLALIKTTAETLLCNNDSRASPEAKHSTPSANENDILPDAPSQVEAVDINQVPKVGEPHSTIVSSTTVEAQSNALECISLAHLRTSQVSHLDPHKQLCRFELQGRCNDDLCKFQHHTPKLPN